MVIYPPRDIEIYRTILTIFINQLTFKKGNINMSAGSIIGKCAVGGALIGGVYGLVSDGKDTLTCAFDGALIGAGVGVAIAAFSSAEEEDAGFFGLLSGSADSGYSVGGDHMINASTNNLLSNYR